MDWRQAYEEYWLILFVIGGCMVAVFVVLLLVVGVVHLVS